ncbi:MAG: thrombospondin type 3 repeat-containing protein [Gammaproteobacteria bacterium]|nr:thrombospondin type 3 repeat-containing protein [Gammaproteobacteria bacterium]
MRSLVITATLVATALTNAAFSAEETLQNDGFTNAAPVNFQAGFVAGEVAAARFEPQIACPCVVERITLLFGGAAGTREMGVSVWEDSAGGDAPGALLFTGDVTLTGSNVNLQEIDLTLTPVIVSGPFRVGLEFGHNGLPSVATDLDGNIDAAANFILADIGALFWFKSATLGVSGDFVIRATIDNLVAGDTDQDGIADDADNCTIIANADQRDTDSDGIGNICDTDLDGNCFTDFADVGIFKLAFLAFPGDVNWNPDADFDGDDSVGFLDLSRLKEFFLGPPGPSATGCGDSDHNSAGNGPL